MKGRHHEENLFAFSDGRAGKYSRNAHSFENETAVSHTLLEPTAEGSIQTEIRVGQFKERVVVYVELRAQGVPNEVGPVQFDIRCPHIVRTILNDGGDWRIGGTPMSTKPLDYRGAAAGMKLLDVIWHTDRNVPVVCVSEDSEGAPSADFPEKLAADLSGLAIVAHIDSQASWVMTNQRGKDWSCFSGAIRLYWPRLEGSQYTHHPLWTKYSLLGGGITVQEAGNRIRSQLRRRIHDVSAFSVNEPPEFRELQERLATSDSDRVRKELKESADWKPLADIYAHENTRLKTINSLLESEVVDLRAQLANLQESFQYKQSVENEFSPQTTAPPATVEEAVERARAAFPARLFFGADVWKGIQTLSPDAGPPEKILHYLSQLHELAEQQSKGALGVDQVKWLIDRGLDVSGESITIKNTIKDMRKRRWAGPDGDLQFEVHMKPSNGVSPDRCARIYFVYDHAAHQVVIGWVGRHPD